MLRFGCPQKFFEPSGNESCNPLHVAFVIDTGASLHCVVQGADLLCDEDALGRLAAAVAKCTAVAHFPTSYTFPMTVQLQDGHYVEVSKETVISCFCQHNNNVRILLSSYCVQE